MGQIHDLHPAQHVPKACALSIATHCLFGPRGRKLILVRHEQAENEKLQELTLELF